MRNHLGSVGVVDDLANHVVLEILRAIRRNRQMGGGGYPILEVIQHVVVVVVVVVRMVVDVIDRSSSLSSS